MPLIIDIALEPINLPPPFPASTPANVGGRVNSLQAQSEKRFVRYPKKAKKSITRRFTRRWKKLDLNNINEIHPHPPTTTTCLCKAAFLHNRCRPGRFTLVFFSASCKPAVGCSVCSACDRTRRRHLLPPGFSHRPVSGEAWFPSVLPFKSPCVPSAS